MDANAQLNIMKVLSNETRLRILQWLKEPEKHFVPQNIPESASFDGGVCVGSIQEKTGLAQSVISGYLSSMQKSGLLECKRVGQWTYYRRNEPVIEEFLESLSSRL
jgi:Predicted transcriptional regulators